MMKHILNFDIVKGKSIIDELRNIIIDAILLIIIKTNLIIYLN